MLLTQAKTLIEDSLERVLNNMPSVSPELSKAMAYSVLSGGKRLRPLFVLATADALGDAQSAPANAALIPACAIEFIHTYSLIHDDLPAMDDDNMRHGVASCHIAFGEDQAILAGDALQSLAFELLAAPEKFAMDNANLSAKQQLAIIHCLASAISTSGMAGGQSLDVQKSAREGTLQQLEKIHAAKTGALFAASIVTGGIVANAPPQRLEQLNTIGQKIGYAFQIVDDILDATQSTEVLGKPAASDADLNKQTFVNLLGVDASKNKATHMLDEIMESLQSLEIVDGLLAELTQQAIQRNH